MTKWGQTGARIMCDRGEAKIKMGTGGSAKHDPGEAKIKITSAMSLRGSEGAAAIPTGNYCQAPDRLLRFARNDGNVRGAKET